MYRIAIVFVFLFYSTLFSCFSDQHVIFLIYPCDQTNSMEAKMLAFDFCRFCVVIRFFHPRHNGQWPLTSTDISIPQFIHYIYYPILFLGKEPVFAFSMFSAKQGHYGYHFYNVFGMTDAVLDWGLNPGPPALEARFVKTLASLASYTMHVAILSS